MSVLNLYKPLGLTPLQTLNLLRERYPEYRDSVLSYAGRLDPLAEGVMLVLVDEANYERENYLNLDKTYQCEILFGFATDTGDILGKITDTKLNTLSEEKLKEVLTNVIGKHIQAYPRYSSPGIDGKENVHKEIEIYNIDLESLNSISQVQLASYVTERINLITGNFRQSEILTTWKTILDRQDNKDYPIAAIEVSASSGTYIRVLAEKIGEALGVSALAFSIVRTQVGEYSINTSIRL